MMDHDTIFNKLDELHQKINTLEKSLQDKSNTSIVVKMDVKDLHLQELNLEELAFHLDKLDIKELSGMLNLGNTFSPIVHPKKIDSEDPTAREKPQQKNNKEKSKMDDIQININGKPVPYTID